MAGPRTSLTPPPLTPLSPTPQKLEAECLRGHFPTLILFVLKGIKKFRLRQGCLHGIPILYPFILTQCSKVFQITHALGAKLSKSKNALICLVLERAEKLNNFGSSEATFQTFNGATLELILSKPK